MNSTENNKLTLQNVESLSGKKDTKHYPFAEHLKIFIEAKTSDEQKQKELLETALKQFKGQTDLIDPECKKCFGRGHVGYNITYDYFVPCPSCFKPGKTR